MLKDKKLVRRLALVLCLSLIVGIIPVGILGMSVGASTTPNEPVNVLVNGDFESGADGWSNAQVAEGAGRTGTALHMTSAVMGKDIEVVAGNRAPVTPGDTYKLSYYAKRDANDTSEGALSGITVYVTWYDAEGNLNEPEGTNINDSTQKWCKSFTLSPEKGADWALREHTVEIPEGAATMGVRFYASNNYTGDIYVDDVVLAKVEVPAPGPGEENEGTVVFEDDFEAGDFRTKWGYTKNAMAWTDAGYRYQGTRVLLLQSATDTATSPKFAVTPGKQYNLNYWTKQHTAPNGAADVGSAQIRFLDANDAVISGATVKAPVCNTTEWAEKTLSGVAPANAVSAQVFFDTEGDSKLIYVIDALTVTETEAAVSVDTPIYANDFDGEYVRTSWNDGRDRTNDLPKDWTCYQYEQIVISLISGKWGAADGKMLFLQTAGDKWVRSETFTVVPGYTYTAKFDEMDYTTGSGGYGAIVFVDASGNILDTKSVDIKADAAQTWSETSVAGQAPAGAAAAYMEFGIKDASGDPTFGVDNLAVYEEEGTLPEETEPTSGAVVNGGFEDGINSWSSNVSGALTAVDTDKHGGSAAAQFVDSTTAGATYITQKVTVIPGKTYTLNAWVKVVSGAGGYVGLYGIDDANTAVAFDANETGWVKYSVSATIPTGKDKVTVEFGANSGQIVTFLVDDIELVEQGAEGGNSVPLNGDFEASDTEFTNWHKTSGATASLAAGEGRNNSNALKLDDPVNNVDLEVMSDKFAVTGGKTYTLSYWIKKVASTEGDSKLGMYIFFFNASGSAASVEYVNLASAESGADWAEIVRDFDVPADAVQAYIRLNFSQAAINTVLVDDFTVTEKTGGTQPEPTEPGTEPGTEPSQPGTVTPDGTVLFEENFNSNNSDAKLSAAGWTASENFTNTNHNIGVYDNAYSGYALWLQQKTGAWAKTSAIAVTPGMTYTASILSNGPVGAASMKLIFVDAAGEAVSESDAEAIGTGINWTEETVSAVAPENAANVYVYFERNDADCGIDELKVTETETPSPEPLDPMKPFEEKFENPAESSNLNAGPLNWTCNDDGVDTFGSMVGLVNNALSVDGNYLRLYKTGTWNAKSPEFPVQIGYEYTVKFQARKLAQNDNLGGTVEIVFVNYRGKVVESVKATAGKTYGAWAEETVSAVAPVGATQAYIVFTVNNTDRRVEADFAVDNVTVLRAAEATFEYVEIPTEPIVYTPVFEDAFAEHYNPEGAAASVRIPNGWTASVHSAAIGVASYDKYDGTTNLCVQDKADKSIRSPEIAAKPGYNYLVSFVEKKYQLTPGEGGYMKAIFTDASGKVLKEYTEEVGASKKWTEMEYEYQAPLGAAKLFIEFGVKGASGEPTYSIDNLVVSESDRALPNAPGANAPTGDVAVLAPMAGLMIAVLALAVLVLNKRKFF